MALHVMDSQIYGEDFGHPKVREIFEEASILNDWIQFEVALAEVQAELGFIPAEAAREIKAKGNLEHVPLARVAGIYRKTMLSSVSMIRAFKEACEGNAGEYIHLGATTQDCFDTTLAMRLKKVLEVFLADLQEVRANLNHLADKYRNVLMAGITHGQQALPVTFGYNAAIWSEMMAGHIERIQEAKKRILVGTVAGAVGNSASFCLLGGGNALEMQRRVLHRLGLQPPRINLQPRIERLTEFMQILALMSVSFEKIADDIFLFQRSEFAQAEEPFDTEHQISSSTMPQKRNPFRCETIKALSKKVRSNANGFAEVHMRDLRDHTPFCLEDLVIAESCILTSSILEFFKFVSAGLVIKPENMRRNLGLSHGLIMAEPLMLALAKKTGRKETGFALVHKAAMASFEQGVPFDQFVLEYPGIREHFSREELRNLIDPANYLGMNDQLINDVIND